MEESFKKVTYEMCNDIIIILKILLSWGKGHSYFFFQAEDGIRDRDG